MPQQVKYVPPVYDSEKALREWESKRSECKCKNPIPGPSHGGEKLCRKCGRLVGEAA